MGKVILHVTRYAAPDTWEFDDLSEAVGFAMEGMYECNFAISRITDEFGETVLTKAEILDFDEHEKYVDLEEFIKYRDKKSVRRPRYHFVHYSVL